MFVRFLLFSKNLCFLFFTMRLDIGIPENYCGETDTNLIYVFVNAVLLFFFFLGGGGGGFDFGQL